MTGMPDGGRKEGGKIQRKRLPSPPDLQEAGAGARPPRSPPRARCRLSDSPRAPRSLAGSRPDSPLSLFSLCSRRRLRTTSRNTKSSRTPTRMQATVTSILSPSLVVSPSSLCTTDLMSGGIVPASEAVMLGGGHWRRLGTGVHRADGHTHRVMRPTGVRDEGKGRDALSRSLLIPPPAHSPPPAHLRSGSAPRPRAFLQKRLHFATYCCVQAPGGRVPRLCA